MVTMMYDDHELECSIQLMSEDIKYYIECANEYSPKNERKQKVIEQLTKLQSKVMSL